jgi:catechol 2,3-dioxygenase-like lactoylglutathione lyase family enzyme
MNRILRVMPRFPVADLNAAVKFYYDHFGFEGGDFYPEDKPTFALLALGEVTLQFFVPASLDGLPSRAAAPDDRAMISLDVADAHALHAHFVKRGVPIEWGPEVYWYGRREFAVRDPNGYLVIVSEATADLVTDQG